MARREGEGFSGGHAPAPPGVAGVVAGWRSLLLGVELGGLDDEARLAVLRELELLTRSAGAVAARLQAGFHASQVAAQVADGVAPSRAGAAVADDLARARMTSPYWGSRDLTAARALTRELPCTLAALSEGVISPAQARAVAEGTTCLSPGDRAEADRRLVGVLAGASTQEIVRAVSALVYELDPAGFVARARKAAEDRGVWVRPAPDVIGILSARLPAAQALACLAALTGHAKAAIASGDTRTRNQLMADELFSRLTGRTVVEGVDVEVGLVITEASLFGGGSQAADLAGYGPIPADVARDLLRTHGTPVPPQFRRPSTPSPAPDPQPAPGTGPERETSAGARAATVWLRRLFTDPVTGVLTQRDPRRRLFTGALRAFLIARDKTCRNTWCGAPIRHIDHIQRHAQDGPTDPDNGRRGLCARCNLARERPRHTDPPPTDYRPPPPLLTTPRPPPLP